MAPRIVGVAIRTHEGKVYSLTAPKRHHDLINGFAQLGIEFDQEWNQGFALDDGTFVGRVEALIIARAANQILAETKHGMLFSEDLW